MKTFWRSLVTALKITAILLLIIALVGIGILGWYFYETTFSESSAENPLFDFIESLVPQRSISALGFDILSSSPVFSISRISIRG